MFVDADFKGHDLPPKTLCLTYDDGPGPQTPELGHYLHEEGIAAAFFVIGREAERQPELLRQLKEGGHLIGNHTYTHPGLVALATSGGDLVGEIARTDAVIREHVLGDTVYFRAPYGNWREKVHAGSDEDKQTSVVAAILNRSGRFADYLGPVNWDISAQDWEFWERGAPAEECAAKFLRKIETLGQGIVLMHDSSDNEAVRAANRAFETTRLLVPVLKARGYRFVRLDALPPIRCAGCAERTLR